VANMFENFGNWFSDRLGLKAPKITQPTLDQNKQQINQQVVTMLSQLFGTHGSAPAAFQPAYQPKTMADQGMQQLQGRITPINNPSSAALDVNTQAGQFLTSGGYDPAQKSLAWEQATRGMDAQKDEDIKSMTEMFGQRGTLRSSAALGKMGKIHQGYADKKGDILGGIVMGDMNKASENKNTDFTRLMQLLTAGNMAGSGSQFTPQSMLDYQNSLAKKQSWDNQWSTIIDTAGKFFV